MDCGAHERGYVMGEATGKVQIVVWVVLSRTLNCSETRAVHKNC